MSTSQKGKTRKTEPAKSNPRQGRAEAPESPRTLRDRARKISRILIDHYPDARCMLDFKNPFELLISTILAAQCTDERVNMVTPALFKSYPTVEAMAAADPGDLENLVRSTGFFHSKAKSIKAASETLVREFPGGFPRIMEDLLRLPGVGRKTANVILGNCFDVPVIIVDTHVRRVAQRLALAAAEDPDRIETEIQNCLGNEPWTRFSHALTFHGRRCCAARKPDCAHCPVADLCPWPGKTAGG